MTKSELINKLYNRFPDLDVRDLEKVVNTVFDEITNALSAGARAELRGFGAFSVRERQSRQGRNPRTGETVSVPPKQVPFFKAGKELRAKVDK